MNIEFWLPVLILLSSLVPGVLIFGLRERQQRLRIALNLAGAVVKIVLVAVMVIGFLPDALSPYGS